MVLNNEVKSVLVSIVRVSAGESRGIDVEGNGSKGTVIFSFDEFALVVHENIHQP